MKVHLICCDNIILFVTSKLGSGDGYCKFQLMFIWVC